MENTDPRPEADTSLPEEMDLEARVADLENQLAAVREQELRERAELENQRKRLVREVEQARRFANERLLADLLPVLDSLEAGLAVQADTAQHLREGMELTLKQLLKVAADNGLTAIDPVGQRFNPDLHQATSLVDSPNCAPGDVVQVFQKGWLLNQRLLRPALVVVAKERD